MVREELLPGPMPRVRRRCVPGARGYDHGERDSGEHKHLKSMLGCLLEDYAQELGVDMQVTGCATLELEIKKPGVEPDDSYYVQNESLVRGRTDLKLGQDPPPDPLLEIQISRSALDKLGIHGAMGVPEVYLWQGEELALHLLEDQGRHCVSEKSRALPGLPPGDLRRFVARAPELSTTRPASQFRAWLRANAQP